MARGISLEGDEGYQVNHSKTNRFRDETGRDLSACWHKLLKSVITLLDGIATLLLGRSVRLPSSLPVRLTVLGVAVAVVICAWLSLETLEFPQGSI